MSNVVSTFEVQFKEKKSKIPLTFESGGGGVGRYPLDETLTVHGAAADAQAAGKMVTVSNQNPNVAANKVWVKKTTSEIQVPTMEDLEEIKNAVPSAFNSYDFANINLWESGGLATSGNNQANAKRLRTISYVPQGAIKIAPLNGYNYGVYCYDKETNSFVGFILKDGTVGTDTSKFVYRNDEFDFTDSNYSNYNFRVLAARPNTSENITLTEADNYTFTYDSAKTFGDNAIQTIPVFAHNAYIKSGVDINSIVSLLPVNYNGYNCAIFPCKEGDRFTVTGVGADAGRVWAFVDNSNALLSVSGANINAENEVITAPQNAVMVIFNSEEKRGYTWLKGNALAFLDSFQSNLIKSAEIQDFPSQIVKPTIAHKITINQTSGVSDVKGSIFRNGNDFCVVYNENLVGNVTDLPGVSGTGTLAIKYCYFHYENGTATNKTYGELASKGSQYTTWDDTTRSLDGGCGVASRCGNRIYFSSAFLGDKRYNNINNYGLRPCACEVTVNSNGVTFGNIQELSLTINGVKGAFDISRIDSSYHDYYIYYTTTPPCKIDATTWYWLQPVINGIAVFSSNDGLNWIFKNVIKTPYQPQCEVTAVDTTVSNNTSMLCFAARSWESNSKNDVESSLYVGRIRADKCALLFQYRLPCKTSRAFLTKDDKGILLFYNPTTWRECACLRIEYSSYYQYFFHKWFTLYNECTWYVSVDETVLTEDYTTMYLIGNNGPVAENRGLTFMELSMNASPKIIDDMPPAIE